MVPLRFLQCWNGYDRGQEVNFPHPGLAEDLVQMKVAELRVAAPAVAPSEPATVAPPAPKAHGSKRPK